MMRVGNLIALAIQYHNFNYLARCKKFREKSLEN